MEPVIIGSATLYHGDSLAAMREMPDNAYSLAIVDPPYGLKRLEKPGRLDRNGDTTKWNHLKPSPEYFEELFRVSQNQIIWGGNNFVLPPTEYFIIWNKQQTVDNFATAEYAWTSCKKPARMFDYSIHKHNQTEKIHATQKPIQLYQWLLKNYASTGDTILDTHHGSGSNAIACLDMGFSITAYEIDEEYFKASCERIQRAQQQQKLFIGDSWKAAEGVTGQLL